MSVRSRFFLRARVLGPVTLAMGIAVACSTPPSTGSSPSGTTSTSTSTSGATPAAATTSAFTPLTRSLHPLARPDLDQGRRDPSVVTAGSIYFKPSATQKADRDALVAAMQEPSSPSYHKWLTVEEYAARFGATASDMKRVTAWLESQGLTVDGPSRIGTRIGFRGTGGQVEAAFHTEIHNYALKGKTHYAMASAPQVPSDLAPVVLGLHGFHDFRVHHAKPARRTPVQPGTTDPIFGEAALGPSDFATLYDTAPLLSAGTTGKGVNLVIVGETFYKKADIASFQSHFGITTSVEQDVLVPNTGTSKVNDSGDEGETELDLEWSSAVAPGANIVFVYTGSDVTNFGVDDAAAYAIEEGAHLVPTLGNGAAQIVSESYGGCDLGEGSDVDIDGEVAAAANLEGITYVAASGDDGAAGCIEDGIGGLYVGPPSDLPGVTGVGGTEFCGNGFGCTYAGAPGVDVQKLPYFNASNDAVEYPATGGVSLEGVWNDSDLSFVYVSGGGGGSSIIFPKPFYQVGVAGMPNDGARDVPDVSLTASPNNVGYLTWEENQLADGGEADTLGATGGTSAATPSFAGILALVNQAVAANGGQLGLGNVNPQMYALFKNNATLGAFHDIVVGDNDYICDSADQTDYPGCPTSSTGVLDSGIAPSSYGGYSATTGYDRASGLGTIDGAKLVAAWVGLTPTWTTLTTPNSLKVGQSAHLSATVTSNSATQTSLIGGSVTFAFRTFSGDAGTAYGFDAGGGNDESWVLGTVDVTTSAGSPEVATVTLDAPIPPGLTGEAYLVAEYSGDTHYLASISKPDNQVSVTGSTLAIDPAAPTMAPNGTLTFTAHGGAPPVVWTTLAPNGAFPPATDGSCKIVGGNYQCAFVVSSSPTTGFLQVGPKAGTVLLFATDTLGEEAVARITVAGTAVDAGTFPTFDDAGASGGPGNPPTVTFDAGIAADSGTTTSAGDDAGTTTMDAGTDAGSVDAGHVTDSGANTIDAGTGDSGTNLDDSGTVVSDDSGTIVTPTEDASTPATEDSGAVTIGEDSGTIIVPGEDSGTTTTTEDAGGDGGTSGGSSSSGCSCVVAGSSSGGNDGNGGAALGGVLLGLVAVGRRRSKRR